LWLRRSRVAVLQTLLDVGAILRVQQETCMATTPRPKDDDAPRSDEPSRTDTTRTPDEAGPHDVPDDEVIEHTLPKRD
jgi:hypothetical protein